MNKEDVYKIIKSNIGKVLIDIDMSQVSIEKNLKDLGANSIDRVEITQYCMEDFKIKIPRVEFGIVKNINDLVEIFYKHLK